MEINYSELKKKEVLNVTTGKNLGKITDLIIDTKSGRILKIVVPGKKGFLSCEVEEIKFSDIEKIGDDVILIKFKPINDDDCHKKLPPPCCLEIDDGDREFGSDG